MIKLYLRESGMIAIAITVILFLSIPDYVGGSTETIHAKKCDKFCGGSKLNPFGTSGTCHYCCLEKGFVRGGDCGDFLFRHCRCPINPPVKGATFIPTYPAQGYPPIGPQIG